MESKQPQEIQPARTPITLEGAYELLNSDDNLRNELLRDMENLDRIYKKRTNPPIPITTQLEVAQKLARRTMPQDIMNEYGINQNYHEKITFNFGSSLAFELTQRGYSIPSDLPIKPNKLTVLERIRNDAIMIERYLNDPHIQNLTTNVPYLKQVLETFRLHGTLKSFLEELHQKQPLKLSQIQALNVEIRKLVYFKEPTSCKRTLEILSYARFLQTNQTPNNEPLYESIKKATKTLFKAYKKVDNPTLSAIRTFLKLAVHTSIQEWLSQNISSQEIESYLGFKIKYSHEEYTPNEIVSFFKSSAISGHTLPIFESMIRLKIQDMKYREILKNSNAHLSGIDGYSPIQKRLILGAGYRFLTTCMLVPEKHLSSPRVFRYGHERTYSNIHVTNPFT